MCIQSFSLPFFKVCIISHHVMVLTKRHWCNDHWPTLNSTHRTQDQLAVHSISVPSDYYCLIFLFVHMCVPKGVFVYLACAVLCICVFCVCLVCVCVCLQKLPQLRLSVYHHLSPPECHVTFMCVFQFSPT